MRQLLGMMINFMCQFDSAKGGPEAAGKILFLGVSEGASRRELVNRVKQMAPLNAGGRHPAL